MKVLQRLGEFVLVLEPLTVYRSFPHYPRGRPIQCVAFFIVVLPIRPISTREYKSYVNESNSNFLQNLSTHPANGELLNEITKIFTCLLFIRKINRTISTFFK